MVDSNIKDSNGEKVVLCEVNCIFGVEVLEEYLWGIWSMGPLCKDTVYELELI